MLARHSGVHTVTRLMQKAQNQPSSVPRTRQHTGGRTARGWRRWGCRRCRCWTGSRCRRGTPRGRGRPGSRNPRRHRAVSGWTRCSAAEDTQQQLSSAGQGFVGDQCSAVTLEDEHPSDSCMWHWKADAKLSRVESSECSHTCMRACMHLARGKPDCKPLQAPENSHFLLAICKQPGSLIRQRARAP